MRIKLFKEALPFLFEANVPAFVWGHHGIGKSTVPKEFCKEMGWKFFDIRMNTQADVGDILGLQDFHRNEKGQITSTAHYKPVWLQEVIDFCTANPDKGALLFFDEINRAARWDLIGPVFQMVLDRRLHTYEFPSNLKFLAASNPSTQDYNTLNFTDKALLDRFCHISFEPTQSEYLQYLRDTKADSHLVDFLTENPNLIEENDLQKFSIDDVSKPSRRTWADYIGRLIKVKTPEHVMAGLLPGLIGTSAAVAYMKSREESDLKPLTPDEVLNSYHKKAIQERIVQLGDNSSVEKAKVKGIVLRADLYKVINDNLIAHLKNEKTPNLLRQQIVNLFDYSMDALPRDIMVVFLQEIYKLPKVMEGQRKVQHRYQELCDTVRVTRNLEGQARDMLEKMKKDQASKTTK